ncbi:MAG: DUF4215 domain-containing protein, partial [bacterium]
MATRAGDQLRNGIAVEVADREPTDAPHAAARYRRLPDALERTDADQSGDGCSSTCRLEFCGDGITQSTRGEQCDDGNTANGDGCSSSCQFEVICGNGIIEGAELCDGIALNGQTCATQGFSSGSLACNATCSGYNTAGCVNQVCGNGVIEGSELCDGAALGGQSCVSQGFDG